MKGALLVHGANLGQALLLYSRTTKRCPLHVGTVVLWNGRKLVTTRLKTNPEVLKEEELCEPGVRRIDTAPC
jgi:hypothetical protein